MGVVLGRSSVLSAGVWTDEGSALGARGGGGEELVASFGWDTSMYSCLACASLLERTKTPKDTISATTIRARGFRLGRASMIWLVVLLLCGCPGYKRCLHVREEKQQ